MQMQRPLQKVRRSWMPVCPELSANEQQYASGLAQYQSGQQQIAENEAKLVSGEKEITENEKKLTDGEK